MSMYSSQSPRDQKTIRRIIKVNHAGEYGAIRIYRAQLYVARKYYPDIVPFLEETLGHEIEHCKLFSNAMASRKARPCRIMSLWGNGGYLLGFLTALMGEQGIWICTSAVEAAVHCHLNDQLAFLEGRDNELSGVIRSIQVEELHHLDHANANISNHGFWSRTLNRVIGLATDILIWLSTWGDSTAMKSELNKSKNAKG